MAAKSAALISIVGLSVSATACYVTPPASAPGKKLGKGMISAIFVIVMLSALAGAFILTGPFDKTAPEATQGPTPAYVPYDFKISVDQPSFTIRQGYSWVVTLRLESISGNTQNIDISNVNFTADYDTGKIKVDFGVTDFLYNENLGSEHGNGTIVPAGFSKQLTITVPKSTPTNNYTITVSVWVGSVNHNASILVGVESAMVSVHGIVSPGKTGLFPTTIQFHDLVSGEKFSTAIQGSGYSITIPNHRTYLVAAWEFRVQWWTCDSNFWLEVPPGSSSLSKDFTLVERS